MIAWFARNHVAANILLFAIVAAGLYSVTQKLPLEIFPSFDAEVVNIRVSQRAATPEDMEKGVASRVEEAISDLPYIKKLTSRSGEGSASVTAELLSGTDKQMALNEIKSRVDAISTLPVDAEKPVIEIPLRKREVINVVVAGQLDEKELSEIALRLRDDLLREPGITQLELEGLRPFEIGIEISESQLRAYDLTLSQVSRAIQGQSVDLSAGKVRSDSGEILLRAKAQAYSYGEYANIIVKRFADGTPLYLGELADINDGFEEDPVYTRFDGQPAAMVNVYRVGSESAIQVADAVHAYIAENRNKYPPNVTLATWDDDSKIVKARLSTLMTSAWQGALLVLILLALFLRPVIAFWVVLGIPVCFLGALALLPFMGVTLNILSLFAFILVLGIVVDDAIVTGESIYSYSRRGHHGLDAAIKGTNRVAVPVFFGIMTTVVAFVPFTQIEGRMSVMFEQVALVVIPVLLFSLVESKLILPAHLKHMKTGSDKKADGFFNQLQERVAQGLEEAIVRYYRPLLGLALKNRYLTVLGFVCLFIVTLSLVFQGWTRFVFFPRIQSETASATLVMQQGTPLALTQNAILKIEQAAITMQQKYIDPESGEPVIQHVMATIGSSGGGRASGQSNQGRVRFEITPPELRELQITSGELVREWRRMIGQIAGVDQLTFKAEIGRFGDPIDVQLTGSNLAALAEVTERVRQQLTTYEGVFDIQDSLSDGKQELQIQLKPEAELLGFNLQQITTQVREAFYGNQAQRIQRGRDDIRVMVRYPQQERASLAHLDDLLIQTANGEEARFADIATVSWQRSAASINRVEQRRSVNVTADIDKSTVNLPVLSEELENYLADLLMSYPSVSYTLEGEAANQRDSFSSLAWGLLFVLFAIYALLAIPFGSYSQPFIVMSIIPFSLIGAVGGHWLLGADLSIMSVLGMLALIGVVVNDSLVLVDYVNKSREEGMSLVEAVKNAGVVRFRAVLLTSLTTFVGLLPLLFEKSTQAQFLIPMAISLGFGILFATFITLLLIPCHYLILNDIKSLFRRAPELELAD